MDMLRTMLGVRMVAFFLKCDQVQFAVSNPAFRHQQIGKVANFGGGTLENHRFKAMIVVKVAVHRRHRQVVVIVLQTGQALGQNPLMMIEHIR